MRLHPKIRSMLDAVADLPPPYSLSVEDARRVVTERYSALQGPRLPAVETLTMGGADGDIPARVYYPDLKPGLPVTVFFHGGGFVLGSVETHDAMAREICNRTKTIVVSIDYRLAPEHKFPAGPNDCLAAARWVLSNAATFGGDPARVALAGDSAGGAFAIVTALRLRDGARNTLPQGPRAIFLMYPVLNHPSSGLGSYRERGEGYGLTTQGMAWYWQHYLGSADDRRDRVAIPALWEDVTGLPPTYIVTAEFDPLRDEGLLFASRLAAAGNDVTHAHYDDVNHGFMSMTGIVDRADFAMNAGCNWLRLVL